jgi:hypothetical protein
MAPGNGAVNNPSRNIVEGTTPEPKIVSDELPTSEELAALRRFAEGYQPKSGRTVIPQPPEPPAEISQIIEKTESSKSRDHEKFIVLIFLRLSRFEVEHFKQRYELGRENPLTRVFYRIIGRSDYSSAEIMPAYLADNFVESNPYLLAYPPIKAEMRRIGAAENKINSSVLSSSP